MGNGGDSQPGALGRALTTAPVGSQLVPVRLPDWLAQLCAEAKS